MDLSRPLSEPSLSLEDLLSITRIGLLRLPTREAEAKRVRLMRSLVAAEAELNHALGAHARCFLVNCQGSHGTGNLALEAARLHTALTRYVRLVHETMQACGPLSDDPPDAGKRAASGDLRAVSSAAKAPYRKVGTAC
jgi:hypothetical protein